MGWITPANLPLAIASRYNGMNRFSGFLKGGDILLASPRNRSHHA
jgi:hypothetical protein